MNQGHRTPAPATIWQRHYGGAAGDDELRRRLRQIEAGASALNLDPAVVHVACEIAAMEPGLDDQAGFALIALVTASLAALQEGSTRLPVIGREARATMRRIVGGLCGEESADEVDNICDAIAHLLDSNLAPHVIGRADTDYRPLIFLRPFIYHHRIRQAELSLASLIAQRLKQDACDCGQPEKIEAAIERIERGGGIAENGFVLSAEQRDAVANAAARRLALISGGPGTGKTSIILAILRVLVGTGIDPKKIELAAPTGKAAFRMGDSIAEGLQRIANPTAEDRLLIDAHLKPRTIHRLLGYSPARRRFLYHRHNQLDAAAVIVDESSMLDLTLMERLVSALKCDTQLILLGDADQLPSVAAGAVFRDLVQAANEVQENQERYRGVCARLTHSYRMDTREPAGAALFSIARAINRADQGVAEPSGKSAVVWSSRAEELKFSGVEFLPGGETLEALLKRWYEERIHDDEVEKLCKQGFIETEAGLDPAAGLERIFDRMAASRILCFTRVLPAGSEQVNAILHRRRADSLALTAERDFLPGEPVMVIRNDYERMLFNGDQGVIVRVRRSAARPAPMAVFKRGGKFVAFHLAALRDCLELCYATTIHKAQGSEFDSVAILLPHRDLPLLTREALYTAVTRGRHSAVMAGAPELLRTGIARGIERSSGLAQELSHLIAEERA
jgi:exodeoxyribonuclease V alpha subunit